MNRSRQFWILLLAGTVLAGCTDPAPPPKAEPSNAAPAAATPPAVAVARQQDFATITRGAKLFQENCASCHGDKGQGHPTWQQPGADGKYFAPPLNGTGHAWHHPAAALKQTIKQGTLARGGSMPAWGEKLSDAEIDAIIAWFQSQWPDEIYAAWQRMDSGSRK